MSQPFPLEVIQIGSPCKVAWEGMGAVAGEGDRVRHCHACDLNVYNLSEMTRDEAERLINTHEGRLCARYYRRPDGTILTADCPVAWWDVRWHVVRVTAVAASLVALLACGIFAKLTGQETSAVEANPFVRLTNDLQPEAFMWGDVCLPVPAGNAPVAPVGNNGPSAGIEGEGPKAVMPMNE